MLGPRLVRHAERARELGIERARIHRFKTRRFSSILSMCRVLHEFVLGEPGLRSTKPPEMCDFAHLKGPQGIVVSLHRC